MSEFQGSVAHIRRTGEMGREKKRIETIVRGRHGADWLRQGLRPSRGVLAQQGGTRWPCRIVIGTSCPRDAIKVRADLVAPQIANRQERECLRPWGDEGAGVRRARSGSGQRRMAQSAIWAAAFGN